MAPYKSPHEAVGKALRKDTELRRQQPLIDPAEHRSLATRLEDAAPKARFDKLVTDSLLSVGDDVLATPTPPRHPERDASSGGNGVGVGQHLYAVPAPVIQIQPFIDRRDRRLGRYRDFTRPTGGSAA